MDSAIWMIYFTAILKNFVGVSNEVVRNDNILYTYIEEPANFDNASKRCRMDGADLASIHYEYTVHFDTDNKESLSTQVDSTDDGHHHFSSQDRVIDAIPPVGNEMESGILTSLSSKPTLIGLRYMDNIGYPKNRLYFGNCVQQVIGGDWINAHCNSTFSSFFCKKTVSEWSSPTSTSSATTLATISDTEEPESTTTAEIKDSQFTTEYESTSTTSNPAVLSTTGADFETATSVTWSSEYSTETTNVPATTADLTEPTTSHQPATTANLTEPTTFHSPPTTADLTESATLHSWTTARTSSVSENATTVMSTSAEVVTQTPGTTTATPTCSETFFANDPGIIWSPGFPQLYSSGANCSYIVLVEGAKDGNTSIELIFVVLNLANDDYIEIYDRFKANSHPSYRIMKENVNDFRITLPSRILRLTFRSNPSSTGGFWKILWKATTPDLRPFSNCYQKLYGSRGKVMSYGYPFGYESDRRCLYQLSVPDETVVCLVFEDLQTEECCDIVTIYDGADTSGVSLAILSGKRAKRTSFRSSGSALSLEFATGDKHPFRYRGWLASFYSVSPDEEC